MLSEKTRLSDPNSEHIALLQLARHHALRTCTAKDLRSLMMRLEVACEHTRAAAVQALHDSVRQPANDTRGKGAGVHNFGFADLFSALRRTRNEVARRKMDLPGPVSLTPSKALGPNPLSKSAPRDAGLARHKVR